MTTDASSLYLSFYESLRGSDPQWREQLDEASLSNLTGTERDSAESLLLERLKGDDWRVPPALAAMRSTRAVGLLEQRLVTASGAMRLAVARALVSLGARGDIDDVVADVLKDPDEDSALTAVVATREMRPPSPRVKEALLEASLNHPGSLVRGEAADTLLYICGAASSFSAPEHRPLLRKLYGEDLGQRQLAHDELRRLVG